MDRGEYYVGVFVDLCKAFDSLDKGPVLRELHHYGLRGTILEWYRSYILVVDDRKQRLTSVPLKQRERTFWRTSAQGSLLGPLIFIVFINNVVNLCDDVNGSNITLFADDMTIGC